MMLRKLKDIPRLLDVVRRYTVDGLALEEYVAHDFTNAPVLEGIKQNYEETVTFCISCGILSRTGDYLSMSDNGLKIVEHYIGDYTLDTSQIEILARECLLKGEFLDRLVPLFAQFRIRSKEGILWYPKRSIAEISDMDLISLLYQSDILQKDEEIVILNPKYRGIISLHLTSMEAKEKGMSKVELEEILESQNEVGNIAEEISIRFEKQRLENLGFKGEAANVERTSLIDVAAGYDIRSYDAEGNYLMHHDRFIEVKGSVNEAFSIFMSANEIEKAKELGPKYWLYFVGGINIKDRSASMIPQLFQDPVNTIFESEDYDSNCARVWVKLKADSF